MKITNASQTLTPILTLTARPARIGGNLNLDDERCGTVLNFKNASADIASQNGASGEDLSSKQCAAKTNCENLSDTNPNFENRAAPSKTPNLTRKFSGRLAFSSDSFVATPIFFNGGDIDRIAAFGTINNLAMVGAEAKYLSCAQGYGSPS
ncbi:AIR synthase related protein [Campylobacter rectus]|uniref:AIR synthase related protein n=1 Tax=Campylobacter rectus TaxID=203 RepID=UPI0028DBFCEE|nr:AIR synthase related protein [Campylobacter rectus]